MEKELFFRKYHRELEEKYSIPPHCLKTIRYLYLNRNMERLDIMDWADDKIRLAKRKHLIPRKRWFDLFNYLENISEDIWKLIIQKTKFDIR